MKVLFVVGAPGVGKTTLVREVLGKKLQYVEKPKWTIAPKFCAAGHYKGEVFDGADRVPYNGVADALAYWKEHLLPKGLTTIFDGDRFSYPKVAQQLFDLGAEPRCVILRASEEMLRARRQQRGSNQNETWLKGRVTKSEKFFTGFDDQLSLALDASLPVTKLFEQLLRFAA